MAHCCLCLHHGLEILRRLSQLFCTLILYMFTFQLLDSPGPIQQHHVRSAQAVVLISKCKFCYFKMFLVAVLNHPRDQGQEIVPHVVVPSPDNICTCHIKHAGTNQSLSGLAKDVDYKSRLFHEECVIKDMFHRINRGTESWGSNDQQWAGRGLRSTNINTGDQAERESG